MEQAYFFVSSSATLDDCKHLEAAIQERRATLMSPNLDLEKVWKKIDLGRNAGWSTVSWQKAVVDPINKRFYEDFKNLLREFVPDYERMTESQIAREFEIVYKRTTGKLLADKEKDLELRARMQMQIQAN